MTKEQYNTCYNTGTYRTPPYGELVEAYALGLLAHRTQQKRYGNEFMSRDLNPPPTLT